MSYELYVKYVEMANENRALKDALIFTFNNSTDDKMLSFLEFKLAESGVYIGSMSKLQIVPQIVL